MTPEKSANQAHNGSDSNVSKGLWDANKVCQYFDDPGELLKKYQDMRQWITAYGGIDQVDAFLRQQRLPDKHQEVLDLLLDYPMQPHDFYYDKLCIVSSSFYRRRKKLAEKLAVYLNLWHAEHISELPRPEVASLNNQPVLPRFPIPAPATTLIGRELACQEIQDLVRNHRLVTLVGPGGVGKTRLAISICHILQASFTHGIAYIPLSTVTDGRLIASSIAHSLKIQEISGKQPIAQLQEYFADKNMLIVLDNFEQLISDASLISIIIAASPQLHILITSRELLHIYGENKYLVPLLTLPGESIDFLPRNLIKFPSIALFVERSQAVDYNFHLTEENAGPVVEICKHLDGLPLAIELMTAWAKFLTPAAMLKKLKQSRLEMLTRGPRDLPIRQQTLRAAITWSYELLSLEEKRIFNRFAIFSAGGDVDAIENVCNSSQDISVNTLHVLMALVDKNLLQQRWDPNGESRFLMLETLREYALEQLFMQDEPEVIQNNFAIYYLRLIERADPELRKGIYWIEYLEREHANIRAALTWSVSSNNAEMALKLSAALWRFWYIRGYITEGRQWYDQALALNKPHPNTLRAKALDGAGVLAMAYGDFLASIAYHEESLQIFRSIEDLDGIAGNLESLGNINLTRGEYEKAKSLFEESLILREKIDDISGIGSSLLNISYAFLLQGDHVESEKYVKRAVEIGESLGDLQIISSSLQNYALLSYYKKEYTQSINMYIESLINNKPIGNKNVIADSLEGIALSFIEIGEIERSIKILGIVDRFRKKYGLMAIDILYESLLKKTTSLAEEKIGNMWMDIWNNVEHDDVNDIIEILISDYKISY